MKTPIMAFPQPLRMASACSTQTSRRVLVLALLVSGLLASFNAQALSVRFDAINNYGLKQIWVDGKGLLLDDAAGFSLIGSATGVDDSNNISSVGNTDGVMRPFNHGKTRYLPFSLKFRSDPQDRSKLYFEASIGPAPFDFATVSMPMEGKRQLYTFWRYAGLATPSRYDRNPHLYTSPGGVAIYATFAPGSPTWGEMIGRDYTVRVTLTSKSRPMSLAFVEAPSLSTGDRNVEYGFGRVAKGQSAAVSGYIQVFRTDPALFAQPALTFQSESHPYHQIGRRDGDGWSVRVGDTTGRFMNYGPYTTDVLPGNRTATFRLLLDNTTASNIRILTIDVFDSASGKTLATRNITRREFTNGAFKYKDFTLNFTCGTGQRLEFRTYWHGGSYVRQDYVRVR